MATAFLVDTPSSSDNTGIPTQTVYVMPVEHGRNSHVTQSDSRIKSRIKCLSISLIVVGALLTIFGLIAIALKTHHSYYLNPVWTGLVLFVTTGVLGTSASKRRNGSKMSIAFLVMSILSSVFAWQLMLFMWMGSATEYQGCLPSNAFILNYNHDICPTAAWSRSLVGIILGLLAFSGLVMLIVSGSLTIYVTCECCSCCREAENSNVTVQYSHHSDIMMLPVHPDQVTTMSDVSDQEAFVLTTDIQPYEKL
ncbi:uncharacterized protein [Amphiura filiformis]|uniref:uncharacterized protein n=1 Tax=Amphiura filiformis TaxID=82378 RepID=UPI003B22171D